MPITQDRMIAMITAAERYYQSWLDLKAQIQASGELLRQGIITQEEYFAQLTTAYQATKPPTPTIVQVALERQHFREWAKRNDYASKRRAARRLGIPAIPKRINTPGMLHRYDPEQLALAQSGGIPDGQMDITALAERDDATAPAMPVVEAPTKDQLADDDKFFAELDKDELAEYIANRRKDDQ